MRNLDGKYSITDDGQIINTVSGEVIPEDEPLFLLRARDRNSAAIVGEYYDRCTTDGCNDLHLAGIAKRYGKFMQFAQEHPERMKQPGVTRHLSLDNEK